MRHDGRANLVPSHPGNTSAVRHGPYSPRVREVWHHGGRGRNAPVSTPGRDPLSPGLDLIRRGFAELLRALAAMIDPGRESKVIEQRKKPDDSA